MKTGRLCGIFIDVIRKSRGQGLACIIFVVINQMLNYKTDRIAVSVTKMGVAFVQLAFKTG